MTPRPSPLALAARASPGPARRAPAHGFSLLEVLVAIVVLSFGVLGVVGLQAAALQANKEARYQAAAVRLARELADLMRGNVDIAQQTTSSGNPYLTGVIAPGVVLSYTTPDCYTPGNCSSATAAGRLQIAQYQISEWVGRVQAELPQAQIAVCIDQAPYASGMPQWSCSAGTGGVVYIKLGWSHGSTDRSAGVASAIVSGTSAPLVLLPVVPG